MQHCLSENGGDEKMVMIWCKDKLETMTMMNSERHVADWWIISNEQLWELPHWNTICKVVFRSAYQVRKGGQLSRCSHRLIPWIPSPPQSNSPPSLLPRGWTECNQDQKEAIVWCGQKMNSAVTISATNWQPTIFNHLGMPSGAAKSSYGFPLRDPQRPAVRPQRGPSAVIRNMSWEIFRFVCVLQ